MIEIHFNSCDIHHVGKMLPPGTMKYFLALVISMILNANTRVIDILLAHVMSIM